MKFWKYSILLLQIYTALVRSIADCLAFTVFLLANDKLETIQTIKKSAFHPIFYYPFDSSSNELHDLATSYGFPSLIDRANYLNERYFEKIGTHVHTCMYKYIEKNCSIKLQRMQRCIIDNMLSSNSSCINR